MLEHAPESIKEFLENVCRQAGSENILSILENSPTDSTQAPSINSITGNDFLTSIQDFFRRQSIPGINASSRVAFLGPTSLDLLKNFFASLLKGACVCILDIKLSQLETSELLEHFEATHLFVSDDLFQFANSLKPVKRLQTSIIRFSQISNYPRVLVQSISASQNEDPDAHKSSRLIVYTSGTSGNQKAVHISFSSIFFQIHAIKQAFPIKAGRSAALSILPLNHIYGLSGSMFPILWMGQEVCLTQNLSPQSISLLIKERRVSRLIVVPLILTLIRNGILAKVEALPKFQKLLFSAVLFLNKRLKSELIAILFFKKVRAGLGETIEFFISGGANLSKETADFFQAFGWPVYNGYGLTETGPVISLNTPNASRNGSTGKALPGVELKIVKDSSAEQNEESGEIWTKGPHVFESYFKNSALTNELKTADGWFKTGDLGVIDSDGYLYVVGRIKSMIVLSSGKKLQPEEVEEILVTSPYVKNVCVFSITAQAAGDKIIAIINLQERFQEAYKNPQLKNQITADLKSLCESLSAFKRPNEFKFQEASLELTSSQKVKRAAVVKSFELKQGKNA